MALRSITPARTAQMILNVLFFIRAYLFFLVWFNIYTQLQDAKVLVGDRLS